MELAIVRKIHKLWEAWNLRGLVLFSLSLQIFLILFAPLRKRMANKLTILLLWSAYLLADWAANFAFGIISSSQFNTSISADNTDLLAFWAPFLLVHLGGPDTITAFALEDNELWRRHFLGLVFQILAAAYVFIQTIPNNRLWIITVLVFLSGIIKYAERTRSLYLASLDSLRNSMLTPPDPGPNYAKLMEEYSSMSEAHIPTRIDIIPEPDIKSIGTNSGFEDGKLNDLEIVQNAYKFFETFKGLVVDLIFSFRERNESCDFFHKRSAEDAFKVIEVELNFIYEILYTKAGVIHSKTGYFFRGVAFAFMLASFSLFYRLDKKGFNKFDVNTTYALLLGGIILDTIALVMLFLSDWTVAALSESQKKSILGTIFRKVLFLRSSWPPKNLHAKCFVWTKKVLFRRWSGYVSIINLMDYCLNKRLAIVDTIIDYTGLKDFLDELEYVSHDRFTESLRDFIYAELKFKSKIATNPDYPEAAKNIYSARGKWTLDNRFTNCTNLFTYIEDVDYSESLLLWHIATELCYIHDKNECNHREFSKVLSDYMLYLLVMQPTMMSALSGIGQIRFRDTCEEAKQFLLRGEAESRGNREKACEAILGVNTDVKPATVKGDRSKSVLFDACILAKELQKMERRKWEVMSKVWVELMSYAASHCRANAHVQQLNKGGELITFVWLLMAHFGLGGQFQINEGHGRAKLIVDK